MLVPVSGGEPPSVANTATVYRSCVSLSSELLVAIIPVEVILKLE